MNFPAAVFIIIVGAIASIYLEEVIQHEKVTTHYVIGWIVGFAAGILLST
jgi:hypothetical protein